MNTVTQRLKFEGVSTGTGPDDIGKIPVYEGEEVSVKLTVIAREILDVPTERGSYFRTYSAYRDIGGDVTESAPPKVPGDETSPSNPLDEETDAGMDVDLAVDTTAQTIDIIVVGLAAQNIHWFAVAVVTRITPKSYLA